MSRPTTTGKVLEHYLEAHASCDLETVGDLFCDDAYFISFCGQFRLRIVQPRSIAHTKTPCVPRTGYRVFLDVAGGKRSAHVGAEVIDGKVFSVHMKQPDHGSIDRNRPALAFRDFSNAGNCLKIRHRTESGSETPSATPKARAAIIAKTSGPDAGYEYSAAAIPSVRL